MQFQAALFYFKKITEGDTTLSEGTARDLMEEVASGLGGLRRFLEKRMQNLHDR